MLELVATMPSRPLGPRVVVTLDISISLDQIDCRCPSRGREYRGECNFLLYPKKRAGSMAWVIWWMCLDSGITSTPDAVLSSAPLSEGGRAMGQPVVHFEIG